MLAELNNYDWEEVFGEGTGGNTDKTTDVCPPGSSVDPTPPMREDVVEIIAMVDGEKDEADWVGVFRLKDGRFLLAYGGCDYTGWDCRAQNFLEVAASLDDLLTYGCDQQQLDRLGLSRKETTHDQV
jgi:hypothetical protein